MKGYEAVAWIGIGAPKGTPPDIIATLNKQINAALPDATIQKRLTDLGATPMPPMPPAEFANIIADDVAKWAKVIKSHRHQAGVTRKRVAMGDIRSVVDWLTDGARSGSLSEDVLAELCQRMVDSGIPLWRVAVFVNTLHPDVIGRAFIWQVDTGVKVSAATYDFLETDEYRSSPVVAVTPRANRSGAISPTATVPMTFRCCRSCAPKARRTMWRFPCCSPTARSMLRPGPRGSPAASRRSSLPISNRSSRR